MDEDAASYFADMILADFSLIVPDLTEEQSKRMMAVIVGWARRMKVVLK